MYRPTLWRSSPAAQIAAVDTVTPPEGGTIGATPWGACIGATDIELPPLSTEGAVETTLSAAEIIEQSAEAMSELESYAFDAVLSWSQVNQYVHLTYAFNSWCTYIESELESPDRSINRGFEIHEGQFHLSAESLVDGETTYWRQADEGLWEATPYQSADSIALHTEFLNFEPENVITDFRVTALLDLGGVEVYEITGSLMLYSDDLSEITFWIGTEDLLLRRFYLSEHKPDAVGVSDISILAAVYHSFNEDFNITAPAEDEIAEPEE